MKTTLTLKHRVSIPPNAVVELDVNECITVLEDKLTVFFVRDSLTRLGLDAHNFKCDPGFTGVPKGIVVKNRGVSSVELLIDMEIGELWQLSL